MDQKEFIEAFLLLLLKGRLKIRQRTSSIGTSRS
jgi:hypothetical protein